MQGWIALHRPDGETVRVKANQIIFIMTTAGTGAANSARSKLQLMNGFPRCAREPRRGDADYPTG
jgi:hypothetical protein